MKHSKELRLARQRVKLSQLKRRSMELAYSDLPTELYIEASRDNRRMIMRMQSAFRRERTSEYAPRDVKIKGR